MLTLKTYLNNSSTFEGSSFKLLIFAHLYADAFYAFKGLGQVTLSLGLITSSSVIE